MESRKRASWLLSDCSELTGMARGLSAVTGTKSIVGQSRFLLTCKLKVQPLFVVFSDSSCKRSLLRTCAAASVINL